MSIVVSLPFDPCSGARSKSFLEVCSLLVVEDGIFIHSVDDQFVFVPSSDLCLCKVYF